MTPRVRRPGPGLACILLVACAAPERPPALEREQHRSAAAARTAFAEGDLGRAHALYMHALESARLDDDPLSLGNLSYNVAVVLAEQGEHAPALALLADARAALERAGQPLHDVTLLRARILRRAGDAVAARRELDDLARQQPDAEPTLAEAALLRGELACDAGDTATARAALADLAGVLGDDTERPQRPSTMALAAEILAREGQPQAAGELRDRVAAAHRDAREFRRMAEMLARAGDAYQAAGADAVAGDRFLRAAHSRRGARQTDQARVLLQRAEACAARAGDAGLRARVEALAHDLGVGDPPAGK
ncbi:MAG: hypothetical protein R3F56_08540 [Planctomycetota bacterium]